MENVGINFELLGSAESLRAAITAVRGELQASNRSLAADTGQAAHQISSVFAQALNQIAQEAARVNRKLAADTDDLRQRANVVAKQLVPSSLSKKTIVSNLLGGDEAFSDLRNQLEKNLNQTITPAVLKSLRATALRTELRKAYADLYIGANQTALNDAARADLTRLAGFKKNIEGFLEKDIKGNLQNNLLKNRDYLQSKFPGVFAGTKGRAKLDDEEFLKTGLTGNFKTDFGISEAALKKTDGDIEKVQGRGTKLVAVMRRISDELDDVRRRIDARGGPASIARDDPLNVYAAKLEDAAKKVRTALGDYSAALRKRDTVEKALAAPKTLAERGTSIAILSSFDQTKEAVAARRAEVDQLRTAIKNDLAQTYNALKVPGLAAKDEKILNTRAASYQQQVQALTKLLSVLDQTDDSFKRAEIAANRFAASLSERGISEGKLSATGKTVNQLRRDRKDLRAVQIQIENELKEATTRIGRLAKNTPEAAVLTQSVTQLRAQRQQVRAALSGFSDELGNQLRRSPLGRIKDYLQFSVLAGGVYQIAASIKALTREVFESSAEFQRLRTSFVAILAEPVLGTGGVGEKSGLTPNLLGQITRDSEQLFKRTQLNAIKTVATTKEYVTTLQSALAVGQQIGLTLGQTEELTLNFIRAAGAFGIEQEKVGSSIAQIFTGSVRVTNQLARNLGLATKEQRDLLKAAIKNGTLFDFLIAKTRSFAETGKQAEDNFINVSAAIADIFQVGGTEAIAPLFDFINSKLVELRDAFVGRDVSSIFKTPLVLIIERIRDTFIQLLPNINAFTTSFVNLASTLFNTLTGEGVSSIKLILNLLTAILTTINQLVGGTNNILSPIVKLIPYLLLTKTVVGGINGALAGVYNVIGRIADAATAASEKVSLAATLARTSANQQTSGYAGGSGGIAGVGVQANTAAQNVANFSQKVQGAIGALQSGLAIFGAAASAIGAIVLVLTVATNLWREYSGAAAAARQEEAALNKAIAESIEKLKLRIEFGKIATNILNAQAAAAARAKGAENDKEISETTAKLRAFFTDAEILQLQAGKISDELKQKIKDNQRFIAESFGQTSDKLQKFVDIDVAKLVELRSRLSTGNRVQEELLRGAGIPITQLTQDAADDLKKQAKTVEDAAIELGAKNFNFATATEQQLREMQASASEIQGLFALVSDSANASTKTYEVQVLTLAQIKQHVSELTIEQKKLNLQTQEGSKRNVAINEALRKYNNQINTLTESILENARANITNKDETLKSADANIKAAQSALDLAKSQLLVNQALLQSIEQFREIDRAEHPLDPILDNKYAALINKFKNSGSELQKQIEIQENVISTNRSIIDALTKTASTPKSDETKYKATRDVLQDFLTDFNKKLEVIKGINDAILKNEAEINASRKRIRDSLAEGGALSIAQLGQEEREAIREEFELTKNGITAQINFIKANMEAAKVLAAKAESNAKTKGAQGDRTDLAPDERDRVGQAEDDLIKKQLELEGQLADATRKFEQEITQSVTNEVKKRLELRQKELDQVPQIISILSESERTFAQQLAKYNLITAEELNRIETKTNAAERTARAKRLVQEIFPLADPSIKKYVQDALNNFIQVRTAASEQAGGREFSLDLLTNIGKLQQLLAQDFPDSVAGATTRIKDFREAALAVISDLRSDVNFESFKGRADAIIQLIETINTIEKANAATIATGKTTPELEKTIAELKEKRALLKELSQGLLDDVRKTATADLPLIESFVTLAQALADTTFVTPEELRKLEIAYLEEFRAQGEERNKLAEFNFEQTKKSLDLQLKLLEVEKSRLEFSQQINQQKKDLGLITEAQFRQEQRRLIEEQLANNDKNVVLQDRKLRTSFASITATGLDKASDDAKTLLFEVAESMDGLSASSNDLRVQLLQLGSGFTDAADGFAKISEAFGQFGDGAISKFSGVFSAVEKLFRELEKARLRSQGKEILTAPQTFASLVTKAGADFGLKLEPIAKLLEQKGAEFNLLVDKALDGKEGFVERVKEAGRLFRQAVLPENVAPTAIYVDQGDVFGTDANVDRAKYGYDVAARVNNNNVIPENLPVSSPQQAAERLRKILDLVTFKYGEEFKKLSGKPITAKESFFGKISGFVTKNIGAILEAVASLVSGFARGGTGGVLAGVGGAVSAVGGLFANSSNAFLQKLPVVGAIFGVVGGIFDVFAAKAKAKAEAFAKTVGEGIDDIKQAFNDGKISLAEAISQINAQLAGARAKLTGGKTGKKGGNAAFAQLEQQAKEAQEELRRQAEATQKEFLEALNLLRKPAELRDIITQINDARKKAEEFLRSFEDQDGLIKATQDAMEFFRLTIGEIRDGIEKSLKDLRQQLKDAAEQFEKSRRDILLQGRIDPRVSEAENKRKQLIDLEREFRERQKDLLNQIATEQTKLDLVNKRADIEFKIAQYVERSAAALAAAANTLGNVFANLPGSHNGGGGYGGYGSFGDFLNSPQVGDLVMNNKIEVNVNGSNATAQEIGVAVADHIRLAGRTQHNRQSTGQGSF